MLEAVGICRNVSAGWLLLLRRDCAWKIATTRPLLSEVVSDALKELTDGVSFSFTDRRIAPDFTFPRNPEDLDRFPNTTFSIMAPLQRATDDWSPEDRARMAKGFPAKAAAPGSEQIWGVFVRDFRGDWTRAPTRFVSKSLPEEIDSWFRDPHGSGGYASFNKPNLLAYHREIAVRGDWYLHELQPALYCEAAA